MNPARMNARGIEFKKALAGQLRGFQLCFNKRASGKKNVAYANIQYHPTNVVEGVLYQLHRAADIAMMDPFEGNPYRYSREVFQAETDLDRVNCWVYVANQAMLEENLLPEKLYLDHLLKGRPWHSDVYHQWLLEHPCIDNTPETQNSSLNGLLHNV